MNIRKKLELQKEIDARNADREREFLQAQKVEDMHRTVESFAEAIHSGIDILAKHYGAERSEPFELVIDTMQAMEQTKAQEG